MPVGGQNPMGKGMHGIPAPCKATTQPIRRNKGWLLTTFPGFASTIALLATAATAVSLASRCSCLHHWLRGSGLGLHAPHLQKPVGRQNPWARGCRVSPREATTQATRRNKAVANYVPGFCFDQSSASYSCPCGVLSQQVLMPS